MKLDRDYAIGFSREFFLKLIDLSELANKKLNSNERWSLQSLCYNLFGKNLIKEDEIRMSNWSNYPLTTQQIDYAALDAYVCILQKNKFFFTYFFIKFIKI